MTSMLLEPTINSQASSTCVCHSPETQSSRVFTLCWFPSCLPSSTFSVSFAVPSSSHQPLHVEGEPWTSVLDSLHLVVNAHSLVISFVLRPLNTTYTLTISNFYPGCLTFLSPELQTPISRCLLHSAAWMCDVANWTHLKLEASYPPLKMLFSAFLFSVDSYRILAGT